MRLFHKILLLALAVGLIPLLSAGLWISFDASAALKQEARAVQRGAASRSADIVGSYLDNLRAVLDVAQRTPGFSNGDAVERRRALKGLLDNYPQFEEVRLLEPGGRTASMMSRFQEDAEGVWAGWEKVEEDIASRGFHLGGASMDKGYPTLDVVVPAGGGRRLAARVNLLDLSGRLRGLDLGTDGLLYALDGRGGLAALAASDGAAGGLKPDPRAREAARGSGEFTRPDGSPRLAAEAPVEGTGWSVVLDQPAETALRMMRRARQRFALCLGAAAFLAGVLAFLTGRRLSRPLEEMRAAVGAMEEGRFDVRIRDVSKDEIGSVAEALRKAQGALERRVRQATVGLMAQRIGHDMRQNLGAIRIRADVLRRRLPAGDAESEKGVAAIVKEVERGAEYISDLLMVGRERPPHLRPWDLNDLVRDVMSRSAARPGVKVSSELAEGLPPCPIDEGEARRALANVVANAHEALPEGGGEVRVSTARSDGRVEVSVSDTGCGIPAEKKEKIFEDFFSTKSTGTGLGMGIVKRVMERHGGLVRLESELGKGTRVVLSFPVEAGR